MAQLHMSIPIVLGLSLVFFTIYGLHFFFLLAKNTTDRQARRFRWLLAGVWFGLALVELRSLTVDLLSAVRVNGSLPGWTTPMNLMWDLALIIENVFSLLLIREFRHGGLDCLVGVFHRVDELKRDAFRDALTGLFNRTALAKMKAKPAWQSASVLMVDVDYFKRFNDTYGHQFGDHVLHLVGQAIMTAVRESDVVFRYGGEEFLVICPDTPLERGVAVGERIRQAMSRLPVPATVSVGVSFCRDSQRLDAVVAVADRALYAAKRAGRNRVVAETAQGETA